MALSFYDVTADVSGFLESKANCSQKKPSGLRLGR
jgi:hypothetical protein